MAPLPGGARIGRRGGGPPSPHQERAPLGRARPALPALVRRLERDGLVLLAGRVEEAERLVEAAFELGREIGQPDNQLFGTLQHFQVRFEQGRLAEVEERLARLVAQTPRFPLLRATQALLYCELDRADEAHGVFEELAREDFSLVPLDVYWLRTMTDAAAVCGQLRDAPRAAVLFDLLAPSPTSSSSPSAS